MAHAEHEVPIERIAVRDTAQVQHAPRHGESFGDELEGQAISIARGDASEAQRRFSAGKQALDDLDAALDPDDQFEFDWLSARVSGIEA